MFLCFLIKIERNCITEMLYYSGDFHNSLTALE